ncbi:gamma-secretase subunit Aph-1b-like isoform X1 [Phyllopteryx taeniolatus]|uniref:gamma-secretase subunit Aph-1b-like isoform X1 n=1 Tax=Phyllopteryx taeniolatus TaxID=161469 RepID=UPI002AD34D25|nr:gamma-secretase subunit Aph-1b-like isoform X1 [Phyllopteryx taeniolatus]
MTVAVFFGCTFIAFGPAIALFLFTIAREPLRVIFLIAGAFFWLVSLLLSSLVWFISVQVSNKDSAVQQKGLLIFGVVLSVLLQETFRFAYYKLLKKANEGLLTLSQEETMPISIRQLAYVSGLGFGFMSGAFSVVNILADSVGPGTIGIHGDSQHYFLSSAFMTMAIILLHMFWGVVFFDACEKQQWWAVATVVISHLVVSCLRTCFYCCLHVLSKCRTEPSDFTRCRINRLGLYHDFDRNKHIFTFLH